LVALTSPPTSDSLVISGVIARTHCAASKSAIATTRPSMLPPPPPSYSPSRPPLPPLPPSFRFSPFPSLTLPPRLPSPPPPSLLHPHRAHRRPIHPPLQRLPRRTPSRLRPP